MPHNNHLSQLQYRLNGTGLHFSEAYVAICELHKLCREEPTSVSNITLTTLGRVLTDPQHASQTQGYFFYKEAANILRDFIRQDPGKTPLGHALSILKTAIQSTNDNQHRAAAESLGSLTIQLDNPNFTCGPMKKIPTCRWPKLIDNYDLNRHGPPKQYGRSVVFEDADSGSLSVLKLAFDLPQAAMLHRESTWMQYFSDHIQLVGFQVPQPILVKDSYVFRLREVSALQPYVEKNPVYFGIFFKAPIEYYAYPNNGKKETRLSVEQFKAVMSGNATLLGRLATRGIIHTAPIPLFHNRVQRWRRTDAGLYEWWRGGRLDRWLHACQYPNIAISGLRDLEHVEIVNKTNLSLYRQIGNHLLGLLLVVGSYFRNIAPERIGIDTNGNPLDVRDLFDHELLVELIGDVFRSYYKGFVGCDFKGEAPFDIQMLSDRMIEAMGVDVFMEEILRIRDQQLMTNDGFKGFLLRHGYSPDRIAKLKRGESDLILHTGPHLGGFNESISLPELIRFLATASAYCVADKFIQNRYSAFNAAA